MTDAVDSRAWRPVEGPWGRATLLSQLALFMIPAAIAWTSTLDTTVYLPLIALPTTFALGLLMLVFREWRGTGVRVLGATLLAVLIEACLAFLLIVAYSEHNPGWDLS